jgi:hypothetical protein
MYHERWYKLYRLLGNGKRKNEQTGLIVHETKKLPKIINWQKIKQESSRARQAKWKNYDVREQIGQIILGISSDDQSSNNLEGLMSTILVNFYFKLDEN